MPRLRVASYAEDADGQVETPESPNGDRRISAVVDETGISKELIHHYLRQGLLPRSATRARYSEAQVRLLRQIRLLREDHHLPLDVIRKLFTIFEFDPGRIESLTLGESLSKRVTEFAQHGGLLSRQTLSADEVVEVAGSSADRLADFVQAELIAPLGDNGDECYSIYDARVVALCERGVALGIPFESFRTIASYVRIAFELEHAGFYDVVREPGVDGERALADLFVRWEVSGSFVQNVLGALTTRRLREFLERTRTRGENLDDVVYRPSAAFLRRHDLEAHIDEARQRLAAAPERSEQWLHVARLMRHAGRYEEAAFFLEQSLEKWPHDAELRCALGRLRILLGDDERGIAELAEASASRDPRSQAFLALSLFKLACVEGTPEALIRDAGTILRHVEGALALAASAEGVAALEARMFCGWLLTAMPKSFAHGERGLALLEQAVVAATGAGVCADEGVPGFAERCRINAAYLLFDRLTRGDVVTLDHVAPPGAGPAELRDLICRLDPASAFAETVFLTESAPQPERRQPR